MKKSLLNLGRVLNRNEQKQINGGFRFTHAGDEHDGWQCCTSGGCGDCVSGSNEDCSIYPGAWGRSCKVS